MGLKNLILIDTDILIDAGRGEGKAINKLETLSLDYNLSISLVTEMELIVGCRNKNEIKLLEKFLLSFHVLNITESISKTASKLLKIYKLSHGLLIADSLITATALQWNVQLISKNKKDFRFIENLKLIEYK